MKKILLVHVGNCSWRSLHQRFFYREPVVHTCEDHRLKVADDEKNLERSRKAKEELEEKKKTLFDFVRQSDKDELGCDDVIRDMTEMFLSGEYFERNEKSVGTSSKSLSTWFWNLGNWRRGENWALPPLFC